jgi:hypothetical protein
LVVGDWGQQAGTRLLLEEYARHGASAERGWWRMDGPFICTAPRLRSTSKEEAKGVRGRKFVSSAS